ncbi:MAG: tyrosine-type recombinase/integrase [Myxococcota bacterium]
MTIPKGKRRAEGVYQLDEGGRKWKVEATRTHPKTGKRVVRRRVVEAESLSAAKIQREELVLRLEAELHRQLPSEPAPTLTVADFAEQWLERKVAHVRESTIGEYLRAIERWVDPFMGSEPAASLNRDLVKRFVSWMEAQRMRDGRRYSDSSLKSTFRVARSFLRDASAEFGVPDPTRRVRGPSSIRRGVRESRTLTLEERSRLVDMVAALAPQWHALISLMATTGMRSGEIRALQWCDLDFGIGVVHVRRSMARKKIYSTKTGAPREIPMTEGMREVLKRHQRQLGGEGISVMGESIVFPSSLTGKPVWGSAINRVLRNAAKEARLPFRVSAQVLRRTVNTLLRSKVSGEVVRDLLGHCSSAMTQRYHHAPIESKRAALGALEDRER